MKSLIWTYAGFGSLNTLGGGGSSDTVPFSDFPKISMSCVLE